MRGRVEGRISGGVKAAGEPGADAWTAREQEQPRRDPSDEDEDEDEDDDGYGPSLPSTSTAQPHPTKPPAGPSAPGLQDLQLRREAAAETHQTHLATLRQTRRQDRAVANSPLEELVPRAEAGSHERRMEKRAESSAAHNAFRDAKESGGGGGGDGDGGEQGAGDLLGDGDEGAGSHKAEVQKLERKKGERELRKEEVLRARAAEREERVAEVRRKEERTMEMLRGIARERFG
ncbi:hypothetical protein LTR91_009143 [Friedmanniomyces endolithicus]|uniref:Uncharacterized protein n=1 Tax=Friedmanniomyces endolithicus TaxID=329885 RepID=A0AAN6QUA7_9PEZI|nr:hypothetical protein LTR94_015394 [Friedmanniomyces endolithicus]KAK0775476.1 hypothetical protein LTR38_015848 [Friedmanniomyces endolithicus]KAK0777352.1 hypothetical protein LTR59_013894 [Friedmanniomyces endolithicus]KAK0778219.1 hypothetical protein LTR75_015708 [Friedmanniomyces endolithicus]KAK0824149.1 hypothetical protein LTR03_017808 [Friedmanniomyces endolithicus]